MPNFSFQNPTVNLIIQITSGLIVVLILYIITLVVLRIDSIVSISSNRVSSNTSTMIIDGYAPVSWLAKKKFNTTNQHARNFKPIPRSLNRRGGAQFTYQFWIKIDETSNEYYKDLIVLMRGDARKYKIGLYDTSEENANRRLAQTIDDQYVIACPLIQFTDSFRNIRIQLNTNNSPLTYVNINMTPHTNTLARRNILSLLALNNWYLMTFIFEDSYSFHNGHENGIRMRFWLNDVEYLEEQVTAQNFAPFRNNFIRENEGELHILPNADTNSSGDFMQLANIKYYNYIVSDKEIMDTYKLGRPSHSAVQTDSKKNTYELSTLNKIDINNR
jgi:hypothetical protein